MAMMQEEFMIVKPMPGRPNRQTPPQRGPLSQNGSFGPSPVSGGECSPPLSAEPPGRPLSATLSQRDMPRSECDEHWCTPLHYNTRSMYLPPPPSGIREYWDLLVDPWEFLPGYAPFRPPGPLDPREYFIPGTPLPPPPHGPQDSQQPPSRPREEAPPAFPSSVQHHSEASKPSP
ncbi:melanoma inhibitory activity protein 3 isoform X1 [Sigmodon hispidus]